MVIVMGLILAKCDVCGYEGNDVFYNDGVGSWLCSDCENKDKIETLNKKIIEFQENTKQQISRMKKEIEEYLRP
jgi:Ni,Fe-hydrogenase maturation factor